MSVHALSQCETDGTVAKHVLVSTCIENCIKGKTGGTKFGG